MMRLLCIGLIGMGIAISESAIAQPPLEITEIRVNDSIKGIVTDRTIAAQDHCVVIYVHTDLWYIHPFAAGGMGRSWAAISGNGWSISTVKREFPANAVAAVLLKK